MAGTEDTTEFKCTLHYDCARLGARMAPFAGPIIAASNFASKTSSLRPKVFIFRLPQLTYGTPMLPVRPKSVLRRHPFSFGHSGGNHGKCWINGAGRPQRVEMDQITHAFLLF